MDIRVQIPENTAMEQVAQGLADVADDLSVDITFTR